MTEVKETPWADGERAELVSKLTAAIDADPASEEFKTLFLKVLEAHSEREASLLKALEEAKATLEYARPIVERWCHTQGNNKKFFADTLKPIDDALFSIQKDQK